MTLTEKTAYIKGLADGLDLKADTAEAKVIVALLDLCEQMSAEIEEMQADIEDLFDYAEELDAIL